MKDIKGYEGQYAITEDGQVWSYENNSKRQHGGKKHNGMFLKLVQKEKYTKVALSKKHFLLHRLIAVAYIPNPENKPEINHKNGDKKDNRIENLEWVTRKENLQHAWKIGLRTHKKGVKNPASKLEDKDIIEIRKLYSQGIKMKVITQIYKIGSSQVSRIIRLENWTHI